MTTTTSNLLAVLPPEGRERLMELAREVSFPAGTRIFEEGRKADRFWIIHTGSVTLDLHVPGRRAAVVETLGAGDLLGWSWLVPPYAWHLGAEAQSPVRALEFDATVVRALIEADPVFGRAISRRIAEIVAHRLQGSRTRLLDLYGPQGSGPLRVNAAPLSAGPAKEDPMHGTPHIVSDVMTQTVVALGRDARFKEIVRTMEQWKVSALPVLAGDGRVIGVVSEADLLPKEEFRDSDPTRFEQLRRLDDLGKAGALTAADLMTTPAVSIHADATLAQAARAMAQKRVKRLPVVDAEGMLTGIVSRSDLLKVFLRPDEDIEEEVRREVVACLFPGEPPPVRVQVKEGVVTLAGTIPDAALVPVAVRLARAVEGVVDIRCEFTG